MKTAATLFWALIAAAGWVSCSPGDPQKPVVEEVPVEESAEGQIHILTWGEYIDAEVLAEFEEATGIEVQITEFSHSGELIDMVQSRPGTFDIMITDPTSLIQLCRLALLKKLDLSELGNLKMVGEEFLAPSWDPKNTFSVPYLVGTTLVGYRKDKILDPEKTWGLLFDPKYQGRVALLDEYEDILAAALQFKGHPISTENSSHIEEAKDVVIEHIRAGGAKFGSFEGTLEALDRGEVWAAMCYSGDAALASLENPEIDFFVPRDGSIRWMDNFVVSRDAEDMTSVYAFLNFMLRGDVAAKSAQRYFLAPANDSAIAHLDPEFHSDKRIFLRGRDLEKSEMLMTVTDNQALIARARAIREIASARRTQATELDEMAGVGEGKDEPEAAKINP